MAGSRRRELYREGCEKDESIEMGTVIAARPKVDGTNYHGANLGSMVET